jgi:hypothetical protein
MRNAAPTLRRRGPNVALSIAKRLGPRDKSPRMSGKLVLPIVVFEKKACIHHNQ